MIISTHPAIAEITHRRLCTPGHRDGRNRPVHGQRRPWQARRRHAAACLVLLLGIALVFAAPAIADTVTIPLVNQTGLDASFYTIYVLGFSIGTTKPPVTPPKMLTVDAATKIGTFIDTPANTAGTDSYITSHVLGDEITAISVERGDDSTNVPGARIYFFIYDNQKTYGPNGSPPRFPYTGNGAAVSQAKNPPQEDYPVYNYIELTYASGYGTVIDISTVDGFFFPMTVTLNDNLGELGQPLPANNPGFNRQAIIDRYASFMQALGDDGAPYLYQSSYGGLLLNPTHHLGTSAGVSSKLNTVFDAALNALFSNTALSITGDQSGDIAKDGIASDTYEVVLPIAEQTYPGTSFKHPAITLKGKTNNISFTIFNPVGFCVVNYSDSAGDLHPIVASMTDNTLIFQTPLPAATPIVENMYVVGVGANVDTTIVSIAKDGEGKILSLTLSNGTGSPPANQQYKFSKSPNFAYSSGDMVFGNHGLFADTAGITNPDQQAVLLGLQRDMVSALNRGVANAELASSTPGHSSLYWGTETNWYPAGQTQNLFSYFMHAATVGTGADATPIFTRPANAVQSARGTLMGMSYGFAYDEDPVHAQGGQPTVPAKYDPVDPSTTTMTVTLGPWAAPAILALDINGDGNVDLLDAIVGLRVLSGDSSVSVAADYANTAADVDGDKKVGLAEVLGVFRKVAGVK